MGHLACEVRRLPGLAPGYDLHGQVLARAFEGLELKVGDVDIDEPFSEVVWQPTPALQISLDLLAPFLKRDVEGGKSDRVEDSASVKAMTSLETTQRRL